MSAQEKMTINQQLLEDLLDNVRTSKEADDIFSYNIEEELPKILKLMPDDFAQRYLEILNASFEAGSSAVGTFIIAELIAKQMGFLEYNENDICEPAKMPAKHRDFYMDVASRVVREAPDNDHDFLRSLPDIVSEQGIDRARKIIKTALKIRDEDFGEEEHNCVGLYLGKKAGWHFAGDPEENDRIMNLIEHKYLGKNLVTPSEFGDKSIDEFVEHVGKMLNPRQRRAFIDSLYVSLTKGKIEKLSGKAIENVVRFFYKYGFEDHALKLVQTYHYKNVRDYDDNISRHELGEGKPFSAVYETKHTRKLDALFGMNSRPADNAKIAKLMQPAYWIGRTEQEVVMPWFAKLAGIAGGFIGVPLDEIDFSKAGFTEGYLRDCVDEGYLEIFEDKGVTVVAPTDKYQPNLFG